MEEREREEEWNKDILSRELCEGEETGNGKEWKKKEYGRKEERKKERGGRVKSTR